ncbi:hypothetical protein [Cytobacillus firmus]|uniref:Tetratricopeptide repeat protein n=1 Tax=Cytobacillus firmus TaxID=1399 RepID=A0AA46SHW4_CYTFI|nr:hypothetical protein [Cytobacillus firmus]MCS0655951.1 hypothetical protein [Cytobacillus firmus]MCU1806900.1 hypothetical protein [Cytobacillus firmus]UYG94025.1 hypothetical protein OD459_17695 [Cytobacillus firmus]
MVQQVLMEKDEHKKMAISLFNKVWDLMENPDRTEDENLEMIHMVHTSRYHWGIAGQPVNLSRGEWQISRVYTVLNRAEPALFHAKRNLEICLSNKIGDFDLAFAYEALARAYQIAGDEENVQKYKKLAYESAEDIAKKEDKKVVLNDLASI